MIGELDGISFDLGREALDEEVAAWDIDIRPDRAGLPAGSGDVWTGEEVYIDNCAQCHGDFGEGRARWPVLSGGWDTLERGEPVKTPGSYWPYLSTECTSCHQESGPASGIPSITNWPEDVFVTAMHAYKEGVRQHNVMQMTASRLSNEELAALAAYFATFD